MGFMSKLLSFGSDKDIKRYEKIVEKINGLEPDFVKMTDEELAGQTVKFRERYEAGLACVISMCSSSAPWRCMRA